MWDGVEVVLKRNFFSLRMHLFEKIEWLNINDLRFIPRNQKNKHQIIPAKSMRKKIMKNNNYLNFKNIQQKTSNQGRVVLTKEQIDQCNRLESPEVDHINIVN